MFAPIQMCACSAATTTLRITQVLPRFAGAIAPQTNEATDVNFRILLPLLFACTCYSQNIDEPKNAVALGLPIVDRSQPISEEALKRLEKFTDKMVSDLEKGDETNLDTYADAMKYFMTPPPAANAAWEWQFASWIRLFKGTKYAPEMLKLAEHLLKSPDESIRGVIAWEMGELGDKGHIQEILPLLGSKEETIRKVAAKALLLRGYDYHSTEK
jgi:hypothetical protein